jgi:hypothetical protein
MGSVGKAWDVQKLSGVQKAAVAGNVAAGSFNLGNHIVKEVGRSFINMGISQVASRGLEGMTRLIASSYEKDLRRKIEESVNQRWQTVMEQATALYNKLGKDVNAHAKIKGCVETLIRSSQEGNAFDGAIRGCRQVMPQARNMIKDGGWGTFLSFAPDIANLGVSIPKLINLVDDNVKQLARDIRATAERNAAAQQAAARMSEEEFNRKMNELKASYIEQLDGLFNGVLNSAVYAPLVAMGTKALVQAGSGFIPMTEQEAVAQSSETLGDILDAQQNPEGAFYDQALRNWRQANEEVVNLSEEDLKKSPVNCPESIETLKREYGSLLHVYKDKDGNLYAQRPTRTEYAKAILEGKASGDPEIASLAKISGKTIALVGPEGKIKLYSHHDGKVEIKEVPDNQDRTTPNTLFLKFEPNPTTGIGHVTLEGTDAAAPSFFEGDDCLYKAVQQGAHLRGSVHDLRQATATTLNQEGFKRFYHDWSLSNEPKQFVGASPSNFQLSLRRAAGAGMVLLGGAMLVSEPVLVGLTGGAYTPVIPFQTEGGISLIAGGLAFMAPPIDISFTTSSPITEIPKDHTLVFNKPEVQEKTPPRTEPADLIEKLVKDEVLENPSRPQDEIMKGKIKDPKYPEAQWKKVETTRVRPDGSKVTTHHMEHRFSGKKEQFKFKNKPPGEK